MMPILLQGRQRARAAEQLAERDERRVDDVEESRGLRCLDGRGHAPHVVAEVEPAYRDGELASIRVSRPYRSMRSTVSATRQ